MTTPNIDFYDSETLIDRLTHNAVEKRKPVVFLLGAPISAGREGEPGVPNVDDVVELVRGCFTSNPQALSSLERELRQASDNVYQAAMTFLQGRRGQDAVNDVIRNAVLHARTDSLHAIQAMKTSTDADQTALEFENELDRWHIPGALSGLANLMKAFPETFGKLQLTTNFDPLLSLALRKANAECFRSTLARDGSLSQVQGYGSHIVHLHGFWHGVDTLHTPRQLTQERPRLKSSLSTLIKGSIVVPVAYGAWDDVFTRTLLDVVQDDESRPEILWTFYGEHEPDLLSRHAKTINLFGPGLDRGRVQLFKGIDCHTLFNEISLRLGVNCSDASPLFSFKTAADSIKSAYDDIAFGARNGDPTESSQPDAIPSGFTLVGRSTELETIADAENQLISISGIGGQGKTSLAAAFAQSCRRKGILDFVDWRDCREQNDTMHTIFIKVAHTRFGHEVGLGALKELPLESLIEKVAASLETRTGLLVLDNVDQYIDLESGEALGALKVFIESVIERNLSSKVIITARPALQITAPRACMIPLRGLAPETTRELFEQNSRRPLEDADFLHLHELTEGHPLWISLIAARCRQGLLPVREILKDIEKGNGDLPDRTLSSNWRALNDKQRTVLRTLAELERPLPEDEISKIDFELNYNQFSKSLKALKALGLVEPRETDGGKTVLDLHPLIRQYVRKNFPRPEREKFIGKIILVLDRQLTSLRQVFKSALPSTVLEVWAHKIDLSLNKEDVNSAIDSLAELQGPMIEIGMGEEFIRLSTRIFEQADWAQCCATSNNFNKVWSEAVKILVQYGKKERADSCIMRYEISIQGRGAQYINLCNTRCYKLWFEGEFEEATYWGEQGTALKKSAEADIIYDCSHNLALARRDNGRINEALEYFLGALEEATILDPSQLDRDRKGSFYGNIGRCYHLRDDIEKALICYKKSATLLEEDSGDTLNRGYIRQWIGEAAISMGRFEDAAIFLRAAYEIWKGYVPYRSEDIELKMQRLIDSHPSLSSVADLPPWRLENRFMQWINS